MDDPLLVYMTTPNGPERDAAWLRMLATHIRNGTMMTWDIPNTLASTIEGIATRLVAADDVVIEATATMRLRYQQRGAHMHCRLFSNGWTGTLVFGLDEWPGVMKTFSQVIDVAPEAA